MARRSLVLAGVALATTLVTSTWTSQPARAQAAATLPCSLEPGPTRAVAGIVDGETVRLDDRVEVRLIGALAPRGRDARGGGAGAWPPEDAARAALSDLLSGRSVALAFAGSRTDRHDRVLAHLFLEEGGKQVWVQGRMVETGMARAYSLPGSDACSQPLLERERQARRAGLGLWGHAGYQIRDADRPSELGRYRHSYQLVRGRVERARATRSLALLELASGERPAAADEGASQRGAVRVVWKWSVARAAGLPRPQALEGRIVLVRGWVDLRAGPEIEINAAGQLETEEVAVEPEARK